MLSDLQIQYIGWACTLVGGFLCGMLTFWLLRPKPKRMPEPPNPVPYTSARGSKPPAPWDDLERRVTELEAELREDSRVTTECLIQKQCRLDEMDQRVRELENQRPEPAPEPLAPGVRVWKSPEGFYFVGCGDTGWWRGLRVGDWEPRPYNTPRDTGKVELHGPERDEVVRDWMNRGNV